MFDLQLYSLNLDNGQELPDLPGTLTVIPPRKAHRARSTDILNIFLSVNGNAPFTADFLQEIIKQTAGVFFATPGSVTYALRSAIDFLNNLFLQRNLKSARERLQATGTVNLAVLHDENLFIAHNGQTHSFLIRGNDVQHFTDEGTSDRGLGVSKGVTPRFFQSKLKTNDLLLMCARPPATWRDENLAGADTLNLESLRRRLINQAGENLQVQVIRFMPGKGQVFRRKLVEAMPAQPTVEPADSGSATGSRIAEPIQAIPTPAQQGEPLAESIRPPVTSEAVSPLEQGFPAELPHKELPIPLSTNTSATPLDVKKRTPRARGGSEQAQKIKNSLAKAWLKGKDLKRKVDTGTQKVTSKVIPRLAVQKPSISPSLMLFIAIAIPIIIVAIATTIYIQRGRSSQHAYFVQQSQLSVNYALETEDLKAKIAYWEAALTFADQAESYGITADSQDLRAYIQKNLDTLGGMSHLTVRPALSVKLPSSMNITKFVAAMNDSSNIYFLDSAGGQILHMSRQDKNHYVMDSTFSCSPDSVTPAVSAIVDLQALPPNAVALESNATGGAAIMAVDSKGNLLYCAPGRKPLVAALPVPDVGWGEIQRIVLDSGKLYVLDAASRRIWVFDGENYLFKSPPYLFFDSQVPSNLSDIKGLAVNNLDLYLLHQDSQITQCTYSAFKKLKSTECKDPAIYMDLRTTTTPVPLAITGMQFIQMIKQDLPDSALYILDANANALYKFGYQLNLFHVFHFRPDPDYPSPSQPVSGFGLTSDQVIFLSFGNQVYFTDLR